MNKSSLHRLQRGLWLTATAWLLSLPLLAQVPVFLQKGLKGEYFNNLNLTGAPVVRRDPTINFHWETNSPGPGIPSDNFSVRWRGYIIPKYSENYTFHINSDNGRRLWVNEQLVIDGWNNDFGIDYAGQITLTAGVQYYIKIEYFETVGGASCQLDWESASQARQVVPESQLIPEGAEMPPVKIMTNTLARDPQVTKGPDNNYYMIHTSCFLGSDLSHDHCWNDNDGLHVWKSTDMDTWTDMGLIWSVERDGTWEKQRDAEGRRPVWAPEIHYIASKQNWYIVYSVGTFAPIGLRGGMLRSTTGRPEGPYVKVTENPIVNDIDLSLFEDTNGSVYMMKGNLNIAKMNADLTGFTEPFRRLTSQTGQDIGFEGSGMIKIDGRYYFFAAKVNDTDTGHPHSYDLMASVGNTPYGPFSEPWLVMRNAGHSSMFFDTNQKLWCTMFGSDDWASIFITPTLIPLTVEGGGRILPLRGNARMSAVVPTADIQSTQWRYSVNAPAGNWASPGFNDGGWSLGASGFGGGGQTPWNTADIWLRKSFDISTLSEATINSLVVGLKYDDDAEVYINGTEVCRTRGYVTAYRMQKISAAIKQSLVRNGSNVLAVHCHQVIGGQFIDAGIFGWEGVETTTPPVGTQSPFADVIPIPGIVETENFDNGGEGVSYHDTTPANLIGPFRTNYAVDTEPCSESGNNIAFSDNGEWLEYTVNVAATGTYTLDTRVSSPIATGSFHVEMDGTNVTGTLTVPNTGGWQTWQNVSKTVNLTSGQHIMRFVIDTKEFNINKFTFTTQGNPQVQAPFPGPNATAIPGVVEAENFDNGGESIAYHDSEEANQGGVGSRLGPDVFTCVSSEGTNALGWVNNGEWMEYTLNAATAGSYNINARVASVFNTGVFHLEWDGNNISGPIAVPNTGDWQGWQSVTKTVTLTAGQHVLRVFADAGNFNLNKITFSTGGVNNDPFPISGSVYRLVNRQSGKVLDVNECALTNGMKVQQWTWLGGNCQ
ncbi:MAG: carbohydrate-binding protein, partial [Bacteroidota bacterium]